MHVTYISSVRRYRVGIDHMFAGVNRRMLSESTSLIPLTQLLEESPMSPHYLRTRAITRSLKGDFLPAIKDLTSALSLVKALTEHQSQPDDKAKGKGSTKIPDISPDIETQCIFQRGGCYLTLAIRHAGSLTKIMQKGTVMNGTSELLDCESDIRLVRTYARKAERDFRRFLAKVDYCSDIDREDAVVVSLSSLFGPEGDDDEDGFLATDPVFMKREEGEELPEAALTYHPLLPDALYSLLLARTLTLSPSHTTTTSTESTTFPSSDEKERTELIRWAYIVARLQSICDGYPLFLPARSP
jgi:hypothetical protein